MVSPSAFTSSSRLPRIESYFSRWARVAASVMSLTATNSISLSCSAARRMLRPMRPNPLMPTRMAMLTSIPSESTKIGRIITAVHGRRPVVIRLLLAAAVAASPAPGASPAGAVVARVGARAITEAELEAAAARKLIEVETRAHAVKMQALRDLVDAELLRQEAARRGVAVEALVRDEIEAKAVPAAAWDVAAWRAANARALEGKTDAEADEEAARRDRKGVV